MGNNSTPPRPFLLVAQAIDAHNVPNTFQEEAASSRSQAAVTSGILGRRSMNRCGTSSYTPQVSARVRHLLHQPVGDSTEGNKNTGKDLSPKGYKPPPWYKAVPSETMVLWGKQCARGGAAIRPASIVSLATAYTQRGREGQSALLSETGLERAIQNTVVVH